MKQEFYTLASIQKSAVKFNLFYVAFKCPVIATDCPTGPREIVIHDKNGLLVENENGDALQEAMDALYYDEAMQQKFKDNAHDSIQHLTGETIAAEWLAL